MYVPWELIITLTNCFPYNSGFVPLKYTGIMILGYKSFMLGLLCEWEIKAIKKVSMTKL